MQVFLVGPHLFCLESAGGRWGGAQMCYCGCFGERCASGKVLQQGCDR